MDSTFLIEQKTCFHSISNGREIPLLFFEAETEHRFYTITNEEVTTFY